MKGDYKYGLTPYAICASVFTSEKDAIEAILQIKDTDELAKATGQYQYGLAELIGEPAGGFIIKYPQGYFRLEEGEL